MTKLLFLGISLMLAGLQTGKMFPDVTGISLENKEVSIPKDTKGKYTFLALASSKKAEDALNSWAEPLYNHFMAESKGKQLFTMDYDVNLYFVPMFTGASQMLEGSARKKAVEHMDKRLHSRTVFYKGSADLKKELNMTEKDQPYFYLLDETGKIVYTTSGAYSDKKMIQIEDILDAAAGE